MKSRNLEAKRCSLYPGEGSLRVLLLISNLEYGGAQRQVVELANEMNALGHEAHICSMSSYVPLADTFKNALSRLHVIQKRGKYDISVVPRIARLVRCLKVELVHSFLFDAQIASCLVGLLEPKLAVVGSERNSDYRIGMLHRVAHRLTKRHYDGIIANSHAGKRFQTRRFRVPSKRIFVVHNGVNTDYFKPQLADPILSQLGVSEDTRVVGMFASFKVQKNHSMLFRAAHRVHAVRPDVRFVCIGDELHRGLQGSGRYRDEMHEMIQALELENVVKFVSNQNNIVDWYNACQITVLTSQREGTPNVLLESMACGIPVVVTNVADNALIVPDGKVGYVVPFDDDKAMADRLLRLLANRQTYQEMSEAARSWVELEFSIAALHRKTVAVYRRILQRKREVAVTR